MRERFSSCGLSSQEEEVHRKALELNHASTTKMVLYISYSGVHIKGSSDRFREQLILAETK